MRSRIYVLIPMVLAIVAFVLSMLALMAGSKPGYLEDYHIITVNTTGLGKNLLTNNKKTTRGLGDDISNIGDKVSSAAGSAASKVSSAGGAVASKASSAVASATSAAGSAIDNIQDEANALLNEAAEEIAKKLGIKEFYSLHLMDACEGDFTPNATIKGATKNVTKCSNQTAMYHFDLVGPINQKLMASPLKTNLTQLHFPDDIQDGLDALSAALNATFVLYAIGIAAAGLVILVSLAYLFTEKSLLAMANIGLASLSFLALMIASIAVTIVQKKAAKGINKFTSKVGIEAYKGGKYLALTWTSVAFMGVASVACFGLFVKGRKEKRNGSGGYTEKRTSGRRSIVSRFRRDV